MRPRVSRWLNHNRGRLPGNTTAARNIKDIVVVAHRDTTIKNAHHRPSRDRMAASCSRTRDAMHFLLVVAWRDLASHVAINLRRHHFWRYDVPRYPHCRYLTINSAYCCHPLMDSMKNLIVASSLRLAMVKPLSLHPGSTTAFRNIKNCCVVASSR